MRRARSWLLCLVILASSLLVFAPGALGDHVYSHQYIIQGRMVSEDGQPMANATVQVELVDWAPSSEHIEGPCPNAPSTETHEARRTDPARQVFELETDGLGGYRLCVHVHELEAQGRVVVSSGGTSATVDKDVDQRTSYASLIADPTSAGDPGDLETFAETVRVVGRLWQPTSEPVRLEGVRVTGIMVQNTPVNLTLAGPEGTLSSERVLTDQRYGGFEATFPYNGSTEGVQVTARANVSGTLAETGWPVNTSTRAVFEDLIVPTELDVEAANDGQPEPSDERERQTVFEGVPMFGPSAGTPSASVDLASLGEGTLEISTRLEPGLLSQMRDEVDQDGDGEVSDAEASVISSLPAQLDAVSGVQIDGEPARLVDPSLRIEGLQDPAAGNDDGRWILTSTLELPRGQGEATTLTIGPNDRAFDLSVHAPAGHRIDEARNGSIEDDCLASSQGATEPFEVVLVPEPGACADAEPSPAPTIGAWVALLVIGAGSAVRRARS